MLHTTNTFLLAEKRVNIKQFVERSEEEVIEYVCLYSQMSIYSKVKN